MTAKQILVERKAREQVMMQAVAYGKLNLGLDHDYQVAELLGITPGTYCTRRKTAFQYISVDDFCKMAKVLNFSKDEVCAIMGVQ